MGLKERYYSTLVVSASESFNATISELLPEAHCSPVHMVSSISEAKRSIAEREYDFVFINAPLPDEYGVRFSIDVSAIKSSVTVLLVRSDIFAETLDRVTEHGVFVLSKPTSRQMLIQALEWMTSAREKIRMHQSKTQTLEEKMEIIRLVNRAKLLLISEMHMDEAQAHRYIEKQAMDRCVSRKVIAEEIIRTYTSTQG
ncbi:MAG: ANTAR domain-containing protein [Clostridiales bacterium]|nr:ANTAR domain-containing protein [Clostridiales bacterium]